MKIVWSQRAIRHLTAARDRVAKDSPGRAAAVAKQILESVELLAMHPQLGRPGRIVGTRELVVSGTPYVIPYRVRSGRVELLAVFHGNQKWPERV